MTGPIRGTDLQQLAAELSRSAGRFVSLSDTSNHSRKSDLTPLASTFREPRVRYLKETLDNVLAYAAPEDRGPTTFHLSDLSAFRTDRVGKLKWNLGAISAVCNLDCEFCYRYGSPREKAGGVQMMEGRSLLSLKEAAARLSMVHDGHGLFTATADLGEDFNNPQILEIYRLIRGQDPDYIIDTTTHGGFLTEDVVRQLAALKPVDLCISLNSADPDVRSRLMADKNPDVAITALERMQRHGIWYSVSIVAWPTVPLSDLERTVRFADQFTPRAIRVQLPGKTGFHPSALAYDRETVWSRIVELLKALRRELATPVYWQPYLFGADPLEPEISGVIAGSPAAEAGLLPEDVIVAIDGKAVGSREHARALLQRSGLVDDTRYLRVSRRQRELELHIRETAHHRATYPYCGEGYSAIDTSFGIMLNQGLHVPSIVQIVEQASMLPSGRIVAITSPLMHDAVRRTIDLVAARYARPPTIDLVVPEARYFGGDIILGDLLTFDDCALAIEDYSRTHGLPAQVLIPSTMTEAGQDLVGATLDDLRRRLGCDVRLAAHPRILD